MKDRPVIRLLRLAQGSKNNEKLYRQFESMANAASMTKRSVERKMEEVKSGSELEQRALKEILPILEGAFAPLVEVEKAAKFGARVTGALLDPDKTQRATAAVEKAVNHITGTLHSYKEYVNSSFGPIIQKYDRASDSLKDAYKKKYSEDKRKFMGEGKTEEEATDLFQKSEFHDKVRYLLEVNSVKSSLYREFLVRLDTRMTDVGVRELVQAYQTAKSNIGFSERISASVRNILSLKRATTLFLGDKKIV